MGMPAGVRIAPYSTSSSVSSSPSTIPKPVVAVPGSSPMTRLLTDAGYRIPRGNRSGCFELRQQLVGDIDVGVDVLHVVDLLKRLDQLHGRSRFGRRELDGILGDP